MKEAVRPRNALSLLKKFFSTRENKNEYQVYGVKTDSQITSETIEPQKMVLVLIK